MIIQREKHCFLLILLAYWAAMGCGNEIPIERSSTTPPPHDGPDHQNDSDYDSGYDSDDDSDDHPIPSLLSCFDVDFDVPGAEDGDEADVGESCKLTADCLEPLFCIKGVCAAPGPRDGYCDKVALPCPDNGAECVNFQCVNLDNKCRNNVDCPSGYECTCSGLLCLQHKCRPADEECDFDQDCALGQICDFGRCLESDQCTVLTDLRGAFSATSTMHLAAGNQGAVGDIINATQWIRDLLEGGGAFPGLSDIVSNLISTFLGYNIKDYQIELLLALVDLPDILDDVQITHQMNLYAHCGEMYRGEMTLDKIILRYKGQEFAESPENISAIGPLPPAEFGATLQCRSLAIDEIHVDHLASGSVRYATDVLTKVITKGNNEHLEGALMSMLDCVAISNYVSLALGIPSLSYIIEPACNLALHTTITSVTKALNSSPSKTGWINIQGEADVIDDGQLENGRWFGSTLTDDFTGEFSADKL